MLQAISPPLKSAQEPSLPPERAYIAIIIDDIGHNRARGEHAIRLPGKLTYAVIPDAHFATPLAKLAHAEGKEVMVHLPMENLDDRPIEALSLTSKLRREDYDAVMDQAMATVPHALGVNNHMGSALTQQPQAMNWLMQAIRKHRLFFIDSRTTPNTVASSVAKQQNIQSSSRDVFLDNEASLHAIDQQFRKLLALARQNKTAIAIGHPYPETITYLALALPRLEEENIYIMPVSAILALQLAERQIASNLTMDGAE